MTMTLETRTVWHHYEAANRAAARQYAALPTADVPTLIDLAAQDASEASRDGAFTVAEIHTRLPHGYISRQQIARRVHHLTRHGLVNEVNSRGIRNSRRYGFVA